MLGKSKSITNLMQQMAVISHCLKMVGQSKLANKAIRPENYEFAHEFVSIVIKEALRHNDRDAISQLKSAGVI
ncbi:hypothetical protein KW791_00150 [Candidatus Parcubacteria bacterium]|nr:hypothetical protein [Candidatus Parcubacteria bacterium]